MRSRWVTWKQGSINRNMKANQVIIPDTGPRYTHIKQVSVSQPPEKETGSDRARLLTAAVESARLYSESGGHESTVQPTIFPESPSVGSRRRRSVIVLCDWMYYHNNLQHTCTCSPSIHYLPLSTLCVGHRSSQLTFAGSTWTLRPLALIILTLRVTRRVHACKYQFVESQFQLTRSLTSVSICDGNNAIVT